MKPFQTVYQMDKVKYIYIYAGFWLWNYHLKKYLNMSELMEIAKIIYDGVIEPYCKKTTSEYANHAGHRKQNRWGSSWSKFYSDIGKHCGKRKQGHVDYQRDRSHITCLLNAPVHSSDECKLLDYFGTKYTKGRYFKEHRWETTSDKSLKNTGGEFYFIANSRWDYPAEN